MWKGTEIVTIAPSSYGSSCDCGDYARLARGSRAVRVARMMRLAESQRIFFFCRGSKKRKVGTKNICRALTSAAGCSSRSRSNTHPRAAERKPTVGQDYVDASVKIRSLSYCRYIPGYDYAAWDRAPNTAG